MSACLCDTCAAKDKEGCKLKAYGTCWKYKKME